MSAAKNGLATHGLAFNATTLQIRADSACGVPPCGFSDANVAAAIDYTIAVGAAVIKFSLGGFVTTATLQDGVNPAAAADVFVVGATSNNSLAAPEFFAVYAGSTGGAGLVLAVGTATDISELANFSNL